MRRNEYLMLSAATQSIFWAVTYGGNGVIIMTIRPSNISQVYKAYGPSAKNNEAKAEQKLSATDRQDRLELSRDASGVTPQQTMSTTLSHEVSAGTSAERLAHLKELVLTGGYNPSAESIANAMLGTQYRV